MDHEQISAAVRSLTLRGFLDLKIETNRLCQQTLANLSLKKVIQDTLFYKLFKESSVEKKFTLKENGLSDQDFNAAVKNKWITMTKELIKFFNTKSTKRRAKKS